MNIKKITIFVLTLFVMGAAQQISAQTKAANKKTIPEFYQSAFLKNDYKQVDVVARVTVKEAVLVDSDGKTACVGDESRLGLCSYRLTADVREIFKGKIAKKTVEFYTRPDAGYPKEKLLGEHVVFLNWYGETSNRRLSSMENSTRSIDYDVVKSLRKIRTQKN